MLEHLSEVMDAIHESSKRLSMLCRMTDEYCSWNKSVIDRKLIQLHHDARRVVCFWCFV